MMIVTKLTGQVCDGEILATFREVYRNTCPPNFSYNWIVHWSSSQISRL